MKNYFLSFFRTLPTDGEHQVPLTFTAEEANSWVRLNIPTSISPEIEIRTKSDNTWQSYTGGINIELKNINDWVQFRNKQNTLSIENNYAKFEMGGKIKSSGDIQSMLNYSSECPDYCFSNLFQNQIKLTSAPLLTATSVGQWAYNYMFAGCTSLTIAPELNAKTIGKRAYNCMFKGCTNLTSASDIILDVAGDYCFGSMFEECVNLVKAPNFEIAKGSRGMFQFIFNNCTKLQNAPSISTDTFYGDDCQSAFQNCTSLIKAAVVSVTKLAGNSFKEMYKGCTSLVNPPELPHETLAANCYNGMFKGCINLKTAPKLPASTMFNNCYYSMFEGCTSLEESPDIHDIIYAAGCFNRMFYGCSNLHLIKTDFTSWKDGNGVDFTTDWVYGVKSNGIFYLSKGLANERGVSRIPENWQIEELDYSHLTFIAGEPNLKVKINQVGSVDTSGIQYRNGSSGRWNAFNINGELTVQNVGDAVQFRNTNDKLSTAPNSYVYFAFSGTSGGLVEAHGDINSMLNYSTECYDYCFYSLFKNCSGLTRAPYLSAEKIGRYSYSNMFYRCINLTTAPKLLATVLAEGSYLQMFRNCHSLTVAPELPATVLGESCYYEMFADANLTVAPELPATTLFNACYEGMFAGCVNLTTAPELPATVLAENCYNEMFGSCISLTTAPELPATKLIKGCYNYMFAWCENISNIKVNFTSWADDNSESCTTQWTSGVKNTGTFTCPLELPIERSDSRIPDGWEVNNA